MDDRHGSSQDDEPLLAGSTPDDMSRELEQMLLRLSELNDQMARSVTNDTSGSAALMHTVQRHREVLANYELEYKRTRANIDHFREHSELLSSVRRDISAARDGPQSRTELLLRERNALGTAGSGTDALLDQAATTREELLRQRNMFNNISGRLRGIASIAPSVNDVIGAISRHRRKQTYILAFFIALMTFLFIYYLFHDS